MRFLLCLLVILASTVRAEEKAAIAQGCPDLQMASIYVAQIAGYEPLSWCPEVIFHTDSPKARGRVADMVMLKNTGVGFYPETGAILLPVSINLRHPEDYSLLLHQIVRLYQKANGADRAAPCKSALTAQAYEIQGRFLQDSGFGAMAEESFLTAKYRGECAGTRTGN